MVFGNLGADSGTGVAFTRDPATGERGIYGDYLPDAQGEDVVSGVRNAVPLSELKQLAPRTYVELTDHLRTLERHYQDLCDVEFTIERGRLWILQTRVGKRTAEAAFRIAYDLLDEHLIDRREALSRVSGAHLTRLLFPRFATNSTDVPLATGIAASPGAAVGAVVFDSASAVRRAAAGEPVILVRKETTPDDLPGMIAAQAVLTTRGGKTSHAAVVARGMGKVCVCGAGSLTVDPVSRCLTTRSGVVVREGDTISVDGTAGTVHLGALPLPLLTSAGLWSRASRPGRCPKRCCAPCPTPTRSAAWRCAPMPTPPRTRPAPAVSAPRASGCAARSTCSSASAKPWSKR